LTIGAEAFNKKKKKLKIKKNNKDMNNLHNNYQVEKNIYTPV